MATLTDREYNAELRKLHDQLLLMGAKVEEMIANSMRALTERDSDLARRMIEFDHQINRLEVEIDELCLRILAKRQPVASDLRLITTALKIVTDLERCGDLSVNIADRAIEQKNAILTPGKVRTLLEGGSTLSEAVLPLTRPAEAEQLALFGD